MPNENCLKDMKCPSCGSEGPFTILCEVTMLVSDDGTEEMVGDVEWHSDSYCGCREDDCEYEGLVETFMDES